MPQLDLTLAYNLETWSLGSFFGLYCSVYLYLPSFLLNHTCWLYQKGIYLSSIRW